MEKKDFSAPWALGLGATRRAAMLLVMLLTMAQTAWATDNETKTFTLSSVTGSSNPLSYDGKVFLSAQVGTVGKGSFISMSTPSSGKVGTIRLYPRISGKVKSLSFSSAQVMMIDSNGGGYVKIGKSSTNNWTNSISQEQISWGSLSFTNASGIQLENEKDYLEIELYNPVRNCNFNMQGTLTITYEPTPSNLTHEHDFTYEVTNSGNTLTATCGEGDELTCTLTNRQISTTIKADNAVANGLSYVALLPDFGLFQTETGATKGDFTYKNKGTNENLGTTGPTQTGYYTASIVITAGGTNHTLSKDFHLGTFCSINPNYPQFTTDKDGNYAMDGETVTLTFTSKFGETLTGVTATGATSGNDITLTSTGANTYTFTMPQEEVNIGATFSAPDASHFEQNGDTYTIKTANGWGWFCFATNYDLAPDGFSGKVVKLAANVSSSEMAGKSGHPFKGTFDGQNYTLTFNRTAAEHLSAPFHYINGVTISNLHVEGTITGGTYESLGGLVGRAEGNITIENCRVSTEISTTVSGSALHGGVIAQWNGTSATCTVTGCVYDGLIYNPNEAGVTASCRGFIGWDYGNNGTITFTDCLSAPAAYGTGKYALGGNCFTFVYPNSEPTLTYNMTNCYYTSILGNRQGRPAATATTAPANLGNATTDHGMVDGYENGFLYNGNYYTPKYGDAVVEYRYDDWNERADVTLSDRTLYKDGNWNTLCLPFSLSAAQIAANANFAGATLMTMDVTEKNGFDVEDGTLYLWFKTATEIEAGVPYLVKWDKAADYDNNPSVYDIVSPVFEGVTISNSTAQTVESKTAGLETVQMVGTYSPVGVTADDKSILFLGDANTLYYSTVDRQIRSYRAYFSVPYINGHAEAKARAFALSFDGEETTGILGVSANYNGVTDEAWYSLDGVRLSGKPTQRGLYINNGKKVVIK